MHSSRRVFYGSAGLLLILTAAAKLLSATGASSALALPDPLLTLTHREVLVLVGVIELLLAAYLFFGKKPWLKTSLVAWLVTNFLIYRLGLLWMGIRKPCGCLGTITDALSIPPSTVDLLMKIVLAYLLVGSYGLLLLEWWQGRNQNPATCFAVKRESNPGAPSAGDRHSGLCGYSLSR